MAIIIGNTVIAEKLIAARCNVDFEHNNAPTPLHLAAGIVPNVFNHQDVTETYGFVS